VKNQSRREIQKADICSSVGTIGDSELRLIVIPSASLLPSNLLLHAVKVNLEV